MYQYTYNSRGQLTGYTELTDSGDSADAAYTDLSQSFFWYDDLNRLDYKQTTFCYTAGGKDYYDAVSYGYSYSSGGNETGADVLTGLQAEGCGFGKGTTVSYEYDSLYRLTGKTVALGQAGGFSGTVSYGYRQLGSGRTTGQVSSDRSEVNGTATAYT